MDLDAGRIPVSALKGMSGLTSFKWMGTPPLTNRDQEDGIWITLAKCCPYLNTTEAVDRDKPYETFLKETDDPAYQRPTRNPNVHMLHSTLLVTLWQVLFIQGFEIIFIQTKAFNVGNFLQRSAMCENAHRKVSQPRSKRLALMCT
jgi:hypothetical protein